MRFAPASFTSPAQSVKGEKADARQVEELIKPAAYLSTRSHTFEVLWKWRHVRTCERATCTERQFCFCLDVASYLHS